MPSRRAVLMAGLATAAGLVAGGVAATSSGLLPGRPELARLLGRCAGNVPLAGGPGAVVRSADFGSAHRGRAVGWALALPPGQSAAGLPVVLVLHGRGGAAISAFDQLGLHHTLAEHTADGGAPFALVAVDGGETYWHPRASGDDPLGMLVHELVPGLLDEGLRVDRIGVWGWSMGGYGALLLARESARDALGGTRVVAAAAASPALFASAAETAPGAFDSPADFAAWGDLITRPEVPRTTALRVSCGDADRSQSRPAATARRSIRRPPAGSGPAATTWATGSPRPRRPNMSAICWTVLFCSPQSRCASAAWSVLSFGRRPPTRPPSPCGARSRRSSTPRRCAARTPCPSPLEAMAAGKKVNGRKRHIAVDTGGLLLALVVTVAGIQDRDAAHRLLTMLRARFSTISLVWDGLQVSRVPLTLRPAGLVRGRAAGT